MDSSNNSLCNCLKEIFVILIKSLIGASAISLVLTLRKIAKSPLIFSILKYWSELYERRVTISPIEYVIKVHSHLTHIYIYNMLKRNILLYLFCVFISNSGGSIRIRLN